MTFCDHRRILRTLAFTTALALGAFGAGAAHAAEIKFGEGPSSLAVDDAGMLTDAGRKTAVKALDKVPGEDAWDLRVWAKLDKGAPGPLYVEFWQNVEIMGQKQNAIVLRHEEAGYQGEKYVSYSILLEGRLGFNKDRTYQVKFVQVGSKGQDITLANADLRLINTGRKSEEEKAEEKEDEEKEDEEEEEDQDDLDTLGGPDPEPAPETGAPPETEAGKKGCHVGEDVGFVGLLAVGLGVAARRRRD
jgi:MYXO-CTERM domain-containing protein